MEKDIGKIKKNDDTDIVIRIDDFGGRTGLTIREFVTNDRYTGFTKAGVRILAPEFKKFREMINSISEGDMKSPEPSESSEEHETAKAPKKASPKKNSAQEELPDY